MFSEADFLLTKNGTVMDILKTAREFCRTPGTKLYDDGEKLLSRMVVNIQSNTGLLADACSRKLPLDSLLDVVLALFLQIAVNEYKGKDKLENLHESPVPFHVFIDAYRESISKYRGNYHLLLFRDEINAQMDRLYEDPGFRLGMEISTQGERSKVLLLASRIRAVKDKLSAEMASASRVQKMASAMEYILGLSDVELNGLISRTSSEGARNALEKIRDERLGNRGCAEISKTVSQGAVRKPGGVFSFSPLR